MGFERRTVLVFSLEFGLQLFDEKLEAAKLVAQPLKFAGGLRRSAWRG